MSTRKPMTAPPPRRFRNLCSPVCIVLLLALSLAAARAEAGEETEAGPPAEEAPQAASETAPQAAPEPGGLSPLMLPFPFYNENFGGALGFVYGLNAFPEPQSRVVATAFAGTEGAAMMFLAGQDLRLPWFERLFIDPIFSVGYFAESGYPLRSPRFG